MSLPRFFLMDSTVSPAEGGLLSLGLEAVRHLKVLRLHPGAALELALPSGVWKADLAELDRERAVARLVAPLHEDREPSMAIQACLPLTAQLSLWDDWLPPLVELGATLLQPVIFSRSEYDSKKTAARRERWERIILGAAEQSHRSRLPELRDPIAFAELLRWDSPQKWVAYELATGERNPSLKREDLAFTCGPEGGIRDEEFAALKKAGWQSISLGKSILRAVTCPVALLGAVQFELGQ